MGIGPVGAGADLVAGASAAEVGSGAADPGRWLALAAIAASTPAVGRGASIVGFAPLRADRTSRFLTAYFQVNLGSEPLKSDLAFLPFSAGIIVAAGVAPALVVRFGPKPRKVAGWELVVVGAFGVTPPERADRLGSGRSPRCAHGRGRSGGRRPHGSGGGGPEPRPWR